jgi:Spy/CpxP family protein refolding chaperone
MKKIIIITTLVAVLIGTFTLTAWAEPGAGPGRFRGDCRAGHYNDLKLTLEQQQKLMAIRQEFQRDTLTLRNDLHNKRNDLKQLWAADPLSQTAIDAKTKEMNVLKVQMVNKQKVMREKIKGVLTPEQLKKMNDYLQNVQAGFRGRRNCGGGRGGN